MIIAKYKVGDVVKMGPGFFIGWAGDDEVLSNNNTCVVITDIEEFSNFRPNYYVDFLLNDPIEYGSRCYDEGCIVGYANTLFDDDDICTEEMSFLF